jgi:hypothetical protein
MLDTREMEHPKPLELAIAAIRGLDGDSYLYMLNRKNPIPLLRLAEQHHYQAFSQEVSEGEWRILIAKDKELPLEEYLDV